MNYAVGKGIKNSSVVSPFQESSSSGNDVFTVEIKIENPTDFYRAAAREYLTMFGILKNDEVFKSWNLYWNQYNDLTTDTIEQTANYFANQIYFQNQLKIPNVRIYTLRIGVPQDFIQALSDFGIEVSFNSAAKKVTIIKFDPIKMIGWNDLQPADIFCVGGEGIASR